MERHQGASAAEKKAWEETRKIERQRGKDCEATGFTHSAPCFNEHSFIKGRQILDSVLIANEAIHFLKKKKGKGYLFKLDFHKAFDSVL